MAGGQHSGMSTNRFNRYFAPAIFGAFDGVVTVLGAVFTLTGDHRALVLSGVGLAASGAVSMGAGEYLSDSQAGLGVSTVIGATTGLGTLLPVVPYIFNMRLALLLSITLCLLVAGGISWLKATTDTGTSLLKAGVQTFGVMALATAVILLCALATGAVG
jgi:VIT1/CCC1 family predicted Fe2+/Mn2+ transporter